MDQTNYQDVVRKFVAALRRKRIDIGEEWFQQDGAPCHAAISTLGMLRRIFGNRVISRRTDNPWPARSPDLNPCDFFLWGYVKNQVFSDSPETVAELKDQIRQKLSQVTPEMCQRTLQNFVKRVRACTAVQGRHFEHLM